MPTDTITVVFIRLYRYQNNAHPIKQTGFRPKTSNYAPIWQYSTVIFLTSPPLKLLVNLPGSIKNTGAGAFYKSFKGLDFSINYGNE